MSFWDDAFAELRREFLEGAEARLVAMERALSRLAAEPGEASALRDLTRQLQRLAGAGGSLVLPTVTMLGHEGEREALAVVAEGRPVTAGEVQDWRERVTRLRAALRSAAAATSEEDRASILRLVSAPRRDVLVVDDDPDAGRLARVVLDSAGFSVRTASSVAAARDALALALPDVFLVEASLSDGSGHDIVEHVRSLPRGAGTAILTWSARDRAADRAEALRRGSDVFLAKPLDPSEMLARVGDLLARPAPTAPRVVYVGDGGVGKRAYGRDLADAGVAVSYCSDPEQLESEILSFRPDMVVVESSSGNGTFADAVAELPSRPSLRNLPVLDLDRIVGGGVEAEDGRDEAIAGLGPAASALAAAVAVTAWRERPRRPAVEIDATTRLRSRTSFLVLLDDLFGRPHAHASGPHLLARLRVDAFEATIARGGGRASSDPILRGLGAALRLHLPPGAEAARLAEDEVGVLLPGWPLAAAIHAVEELVEVLGAREYASLAGPLRITVTAGMAASRGSSASGGVDAWLAAAGEALERASARGGGCLVVEDRGRTASQASRR